MTSYLKELAKGTDKLDAFSLAFGKSQKDFNENLTWLIKRWAKSGQENI